VLVLLINLLGLFCISLIRLVLVNAEPPTIIHITNSKKYQATSKSEISTSVFNGIISFEQLNIIRLHGNDRGSQPHPDDIPAVIYPSFANDEDTAYIRKPHNEIELPLSWPLLNKLIRLTGFDGTPDDIADKIQYFRTCRLSAKQHIGSVISQRASRKNRSSHYACYRATGGFRIGTCFGFIKFEDQRFALIQRWTGVRRIGRHYTYRQKSGDNCIWELIRASSLHCQVGVLTNIWAAHERRFIIGLTKEARESGVQ
jgi:hypothetical protein